MKTKAITGIVLTMLFLVMVSPVDVSVEVADSDVESEDFVAQSGVDWWPMFHHDLKHTGYSTSTAPNTNNTIWTYTTGGGVDSSPAVADGRVYVGSWDGKVYCLRASDGYKEWEFPTTLDVWSSPAVADGKVYVGSYDGKVYCLDALTGASIWSYTTGGKVYSSPAVADGRVYVASYDNGNVYAFGPSPADTITLGISWLATQQNVDGSWGLIDQVGKTGFAVLKFETHAVGIGEDPLDPTYEYYSQVRDGLDYIFANADVVPISVQPGGDPDTDGDDIGVVWPLSLTYETSIAMMAIAASTHPEMLVNVPGSAVNGWTYKDVVCDAVDYLAFGQNDAGPERGGWGNVDNDVGESDNSNTGYAVLGLAYAEASTIDSKTGFGCTIPAFVRSELNIWIDYIQNDVGVGDPANDGGSGYTHPDEMVNILKTGSLLFEMAFYGDTEGTLRVQDAIDYLVRHWNDANDDPGWKGQLDPLTPPFSPPASYQAMYATMKGLEMLGIAEIDGIDWQADFADVLVAQQNLDGSWPWCIFDDGEMILSTEWALLTLQKAVPPPHPLQDLELHPREIVDLEDPTGTQWHELHPVKSNYYKLTSWEPNWVLSPCDQIFMEPMEPPVDWFEVDEVTIDLVVRDENDTLHWLDYKCGYWVFKKDVWKSPVSSKWNEIKPDLGRCWHLTGWEDAGDSELSTNDVIDMTPMFPFPGPVTWFQVLHVTVTLKLTSKLNGMQRYLEFAGELDEFQGMDYIHYPVCTPWEEIWPELGPIWHLISWVNSPILSPSDHIALTLKDEFGEPIPGTEAEYHVDKLTVAMNLTSKLDEREHIVKFEGSLKQFMKYHWEDPNSTQWHEVNPNYCRQWHLLDWFDTDIIGILDPCDQILMVDKETGELEEFHVKALSTDIIVTPRAPIELYIPYGVPNMQSFVGVRNNGPTPATFTVTLEYESAPGTWDLIAQKSSETIDPGESKAVDFRYELYDAGLTFNPNVHLRATTATAQTEAWTHVTLPGDIDSTNDVGLSDAITLSTAYNPLALPVWPPVREDINCDGIVSLKDAVILGVLYGQPGEPGWPEPPP